MINLIKQVHEDYLAHDKRWAIPGFQAIALHRFGCWQQKIKRRIFRAPLTVVARTLFVFVRNVYGIEIPFSVKLGRRVVIYHQNGIVIHGNAIIGDDCIIRQGVTLGIRSMDRLDDAPQLGNGVDIGCGAKILGGVKIGDGAKIGANAVVLKNVPANATAIGVPAQVWNFQSHHPTAKQ